MMEVICTPKSNGFALNYHFYAAITGYDDIDNFIIPAQHPRIVDWLFPAPSGIIDAAIYSIAPIFSVVPLPNFVSIGFLPIWHSPSPNRTVDYRQVSVDALNAQFVR